MTFAPLPRIAGGWPCIVADPPWQFRDKGSRIAPDQRSKRRARKGYRTLDREQLLALPVPDVVAPDALLFLWTTSAHLLDGTSPAVVRAWGFEPKTTIAWVKFRASTGRLQLGMGHYTRGAHELVIVCRRGRARVRRHDVPSVLFAPRRSHSTKPEAFRALVEQLAVGPYLELFARSRRAGWSAWGDQVRRAAG